MSEKEIAKLNDVSHSTVSRYIDNSFTNYSPKRNYLPPHPGFDEFKSCRDARGNMNFIITDLENHETFDIVENRQTRFIKKYFSQFSRKARMAVKTIVIDLYEPYIAVINDVFPKAKIIFDIFHIKNHLSRALTKTKIEIMKKFNTRSIEYKRLNKYLKRVAFGYKSFYHFRNRILITMKLKKQFNN